MKVLVKYCFLASLLSFVGGALYAQKKKEKPKEDKEAGNIVYNPSIAIDGSLADWGDSLRFSYEKQNIAFDIANDGEHLYVAMKTIDIDAQMQALRQGFNIMINTEGKKKPGPEITFPIPDRESLRTLMALNEEDRPVDIREGILTTVKAIYVSGFDDLVDGPISLKNHYGIEAMVTLDSAKNSLSYEVKIPLSRLFLHYEGQPLAFNVKINGTIVRMVSDTNLNNPYGRMGQRGGYGSNYGYPYFGNMGNQTMRRETREEPGKWITLPLATKD